jgi:hypothetical protein
MSPEQKAWHQRGYNDGRKGHARNLSAPAEYQRAFLVGQRERKHAT